MTGFEGSIWLKGLSLFGSIRKRVDKDEKDVSSRLISFFEFYLLQLDI